MAGMQEKAINLISLFPSAQILDSKSNEKLSKSLKKAGLEIDSGKYFSASLFLSFFLSAYFSILSYFLFLRDFLSSVALFLILFGLFLLLCIRVPQALAGRRAALVEYELPSVLREIALFLDLGMPFETALSKIAEGKYFLSGEFGNALRRIRSGSSVQDSLLRMGDSFSSKSLMRACNQLVSSYEYGTGGENLRRLSSDLIDIQKARGREYSSKLSFLGLLFISTSALVPAFFQVAFTVFSALPGFELGRMHLFAGFILLFPGLNLLVLAFAWAVAPSGNPPEKFSLKNFLSRKGISFETFIWGAAGSALLGLFLLVLGVFWGFLLLPGALLLFLPILAYYYCEHLERKRIAQIEEEIPEALFHAASLQGIASQEKIVKNIGESSHGPLSEEFLSASRQIKSGMGVSLALSDMGKRSGSAMLARVNSLMLHGYKTGGEIRMALRESAENAFSFLSLKRERASILSMQKYTILAGCGMLVPLILGTVVSISGSLDFPGLLGERPEYSGQALKDDMLLADRIYIVLSCFLSSLMLSYMEGDRSRFLPYLVFMLATSLLLFSFSSEFRLLEVGI